VFAKEFVEITDDNDGVSGLPGVARVCGMLRRLIVDVDGHAAACGSEIDNRVYGICDHEWNKDWYDVMSGGEDHSVQRITCSLCGMLKRD
jgi:hypothetical protein